MTKIHGRLLDLLKRGVGVLDSLASRSMISSNMQTAAVVLVPDHLRRPAGCRASMELVTMYVCAGSTATLRLTIVLPMSKIEIQATGAAVRCVRKIIWSLTLLAVSSASPSR